MNKREIFYHKNCADGFAARCIAESIHGSSANYHAVNYDEPFSPIDYAHAPEALFLDFTPKLQHLADLYWMTENVTVIDHHKTQLEVHLKWARPPEGKGRFFNSIFDEGKSGCALTWEHFHPGEPLPWGLALIQNRDLGFPWTQPHHLYNEPSMNFHAGIMALPRTLEAWWEFLKPDSISTQELESEGKRLREKDAGLIRAICTDQLVYLNFHGEEIPAIHSFPLRLTSDALHLLLQRHPTAPFAAAYHLNTATGRTVYSLRSRDGGRDVSAEAKAMDTGGGGHTHAAGFSLATPLPFV